MGTTVESFMNSLKGVFEKYPDNPAEANESITNSVFVMPLAMTGYDYSRMRDLCITLANRSMQMGMKKVNNINDLNNHIKNGQKDSRPDYMG